MTTTAKYLRFEAEGREKYGFLDGDKVRELAGHYVRTAVLTGVEYEFAKVKVLSPTVPSKVICIGLNYKAHAEERGKQLPEEPMMFLKPPSSIIGTGEEIVLPDIAKDVEYEGELAVVIGKRAYQVSAADAAQHVFGVTVLNDVSERYYQAKDGQWGRAKGFHTFCPLGPYVVSGLDYQNLQLETKINGVVKQSSSTADMIFTVNELVAFASQVMILEPGDILTTGTPAGVGPLRKGDLCEITLEGVGTLTNRVRA
ncbi:hypothetical protein CBW65_20050 [Tumebacillus avium]|uniref:2-hydroxyhepta-2,4-diene-1,7-dioate isomerase n=1 Tax=Tumebacillus avium TaxID=1903704 RepID=A0A1Y0ISM6_9BACL|nr:fumarylacetoacetate hydrolase family protein [Tumebacillus avium]ARU63009.1 hypothetical protein CBW65_20050 [Tumebacillus avium]